jgi:hypothetical protein
MRQNMPVYDEEVTKEANKEKSTCRGLSVHPYFLLSVNFLIARLLCFQIFKDRRLREVQKLPMGI